MSSTRPRGCGISDPAEKGSCLKKYESKCRSGESGFTIIELLVVVTIIALLIALLVPAIGKAREAALLTQSQGNLRNLAAANANYGAAWNDRQWSLVADDVGQYGSCCYADYIAATGGCPASTVLGYGGTCPPSSQIGLWAYWMPCVTGNFSGNWTVLWPFQFGSTCGGSPGFGAWRMCNAQSFNNYVGGKFYDRTFYAPKDKVLLTRAECAFERGDDFTLLSDVQDGIVFSSYCFSPAAMWSPDVLGAKGFKIPCTQSKAAWKSPTASQAAYSDVKTRMLEHQWLQNQQGGEYNGNFTGTQEPWFFNLAYNSAPATLFFDGHVAVAGVASAMNADQQVYAQNQGQPGIVNPGLWVRTIGQGPWTAYGGYYSAVAAYDSQVNSSYHVFTTDGILGRDFFGDQ